MSIPWSGVAAVGVGAALGAWMRWGLGVMLNAVVPNLPLGTLAANLTGGYLIGLAVAAFAADPSVSAETRLFIITGFLGGLTTFSTFSGEAVSLLGRGQLGWAMAHISVHLGGSLVMTWLGLLTVRWWRG